MILFRRVFDWFCVNIRLAVLLHRARVKPVGVFAFAKTIHFAHGTDHSLRYVGISVPALTNMGAAGKVREYERLHLSGTSRKSLNLAMGKAFSEYLECLAIWKKGDNPELSRSGWATANTRERALSNAYAELVERDAFLTHFLVPSLTTTVGACPTGFEELNPRCVILQSADCDIVVALVGVAHPLVASAPYYLGLGTGSTKESAISKAMDECLMLRSEWRPEIWEGLSLGPRRSMFMRHWSAGSDGDVKGKLEKIFNGGGNAHPCAFQSDKSKLTIKYECQFGERFFVCGCAHPDLLPISFGQSWDDAKAEIERRLKAKGLGAVEWGIHPFV